MNTASYVASSIAWGVGGLLIGLFIGWNTRTLWEVKKAVTGDDTTPPEPRHRAPHALNIVGVVILLLLGTVVYLSARTLECQAEFNARYLAVLRSQDAAQAEVTAAQRQLLLTIVTDGGDSAPAIRTYIEALDAAETMRVRNPIPARSDCGWWPG